MNYSTLYQYFLSKNRHHAVEIAHYLFFLSYIKDEYQDLQKQDRSKVNKNRTNTKPFSEDDIINHKIAIVDNFIVMFSYFIAKDRYLCVVFSYYIEIFHYFIAKFSYFYLGILCLKNYSTKMSPLHMPACPNEFVQAGIFVQASQTPVDMAMSLYEDGVGRSWAAKPPNFFHFLHP